MCVLLGVNYSLYTHVWICVCIYVKATLFINPIASYDAVESQRLQTILIPLKWN
jgi:hypothetical protein